MRLKSKSISLFFLLVFSSILVGQSIVVKCPQEVAVGESFTINFIVEGADLDGLVLPNLDAFEVVGGPMRSSQISIINGSTTQIASLGYQLLATKKGSFTIGSASVNAKGKKIVSRPITIKVGGGIKVDPTITTDKDLFIRMELSPKLDQYYVGQQIVVKYVVYYNQDIQLNQIFDEPSFAHFFSQDINSQDNESATTQINGKMYNKAAIKIQAVFPQKEGVYDLGTFKARIGISNGQDGGGIFAIRDYRPVVVESNALKLTIVPLPANPPASFTGAVGDYSFSASIDKTTVAEKETIKLMVNIEGNGDSKLVNAPKFSFDPSLEVYDANKLHDNIEYNGQYQQHSSNYEYFVIPGKVGKYTLIPEFSYFNPESQKYVTIKGDEMPVNVVASAADINDADASLPSNGQRNLQGSNLPSWIYGMIGAAIFGGLGYLIWLFFIKKSNEASKTATGKVQGKWNKTTGQKNQLSSINSGFPSTSHPEFYKELQNYLFLSISKNFHLSNASPTIPYIVNAIKGEKGEEAALAFKNLFLSIEEGIY
ncbi:MAG TPA: BatD family protein, partial [Saprospiraceae bacterium]|nr:BatD family protein [Saprospiraceae bacterium]